MTRALRCPFSLGKYNMAPPASVSFISAPSSITKGNSGTFSVTETGSLINATLYWVINNVTTTNSNFSATSGSYTDTSGSGSFSIATQTDGIFQSDLTFTVSIWTGVGGTGVLKATSSSITVTSPAPIIPAVPSPIRTFQNPTNITQVTIPNEITGIPSIDWNFNSTAIAPGAYATSTKPLYTISGLWMEKFLSNTSQLWLTNYKFTDPGRTVVGIELQLNVLRAARIEDLLIQLTLGGNLIGNNLASTVNPVQSDMYTGALLEPLHPVGDLSIYGSSTDLWGTTLSSADVADPTFGVVVSFKSNVIYPHRDTVYLDQASLRITYA
jgi:hypothetical protein